jgi:hypothetical protein
VAQAPPAQVSVPLQNKPSTQVEPFGSFKVQLSVASLHDSEQSASASPTFAAHGSPLCVEHAPPVHVSVPLQNSPSLHAKPFGSAARQLSADSLHDSEQSPSPSTPGHGSPACVEHVPVVHESAPLQNNPSAQAEPFGSFARQLSATSLHDSAQFESPSAPGQGSPVCTEQLPPAHVSVPLQNKLSLHGSVFGLCRHVPVALHTSSVQTFESLVHGVLTGWKPLSVQLPVPSQRSWFVHAVPESPHNAVGAS